MDPTALVTFLFRAPIYARTVELLGSWDNFSQPYRMHHDRKRGKTFWSGCFRFQNIIFDGDKDNWSRARNGGLKQGGTYWYYYRLNDDLELYDESRESTAACPLLPGQKMNVIEVPMEVEERPRSRSASVDLTGTLTRLSSTHTLDPGDKFAPLDPPPISKVHKYCRSDLALSGRLEGTDALGRHDSMQPDPPAFEMAKAYLDVKQPLAGYSSTSDGDGDRSSSYVDCSPRSPIGNSEHTYVDEAYDFLSSFLQRPKIVSPDVLASSRPPSRGNPAPSGFDYQAASADPNDDHNDLALESFDFDLYTDYTGFAMSDPLEIDYDFVSAHTPPSDPTYLLDRPRPFTAPASQIYSSQSPPLSSHSLSFSHNLVANFSRPLASPPPSPKRSPPAPSSATSTHDKGTTAPRRLRSPPPIPQRLPPPPPSPLPSMQDLTEHLHSLTCSPSATTLDEDPSSPLSSVPESIASMPTPPNLMQYILPSESSPMRGRPGTPGLGILDHVAGVRGRTCEVSLAETGEVSFAETIFSELAFRRLGVT